jgi:Cys-tRNA(Pro)/Cys-tRNA(Cys) deacylase
MVKGIYIGDGLSLSLMLWCLPCLFFTFVNEEHPLYDITCSSTGDLHMTVNNVTRLLDAKKIAYQVFELPAEKLGALETAQFLRVPLEQVFKTIVVNREGKGKPILAVVPGSAEVDLKALAKSVGEKKLHLPTERAAEQLTGLQAGGISPLALINRGFQVVLDSDALKYPQIHISGGQRGLNICLRVKDLVSLTNARLAPISHKT